VIPEQDLESARTDYFKLSRNNAQRVLRFWQVRQSAKGAPAAPDGAAPNLSPGPHEPPPIRV
jgi:hypothetical protein